MPVAVLLRKLSSHQLRPKPRTELFFLRVDQQALVYSCIRTSSCTVHDLNLMVTFVICAGQLSDRGVKLTLRSRFLPSSCFQDLDFTVSCSERSQLWPDDQPRDADGSVCHLTDEGLHNLLQRAKVHQKVMGFYKMSCIISPSAMGPSFHLAIPKLRLISYNCQTKATMDSHSEEKVTIEML